MAFGDNFPMLIYEGTNVSANPTAEQIIWPCCKDTPDTPRQWQRVINSHGSSFFFFFFSPFLKPAEPNGASFEADTISSPNTAWLLATFITVRRGGGRRCPTTHLTAAAPPLRPERPSPPAGVKLTDVGPRGGAGRWKG